MANMKVVNTEWTGSCVIACDCGSEEPVEGTVHAVASGVLEDEIKKLRSEGTQRIRELESLERKAFNYSEKNLELNNTIVEQEQRLSELQRLGSLTNDEMREEWKGFMKMLQETQEKNSELKNRNMWLHREWIEALDLVSVAGSRKLEEENESFREEVVRCHTIDDDRRRVVRELRSQIATWKRLWQGERKKNRGENFSPHPNPYDQYYTNEDE